MEFLIYSLAWGMALALMASGLSFYYAVSKVANFAHGEYVSIGALAYLFLVGLEYGLDKCRGFNIVNYAMLTPDKLWIVVAVFIVGGLVAAASFVAVFWPLTRRGALPLQLMVVSIGLMFVIRFILYVIASTFDWLTLPSPQATAFSIAGVRVNLAEILAMVLALAATLGIALFTTKTLLGVSMRAVADNPDLAEASGISSFRVQLVAWFIGGGLAAVGGMLMFMLTGPPGERPIVEIGWMNLLSIFAAATLGGLGSYYGTLAASIILGLAYNQVAAWLLYAGLDPQLALAVPFTVTLFVLLFMPQGLAGINWYGILARIQKKIGYRGGGVSGSF
ncbi:MAG TPA: branched-chain amino acid ABC transporter permease [Pyrodictium sp.]|nr:branched-chain amino acid ABC transporter permease [Pyrodictium sp.]